MILLIIADMDLYQMLFIKLLFTKGSGVYTSFDS